MDDYDDNSSLSQNLSHANLGVQKRNLEVVRTPSSSLNRQRQIYG